MFYNVVMGLAVIYEAAPQFTVVKLGREIGNTAQLVRSILVFRFMVCPSTVVLGLLVCPSTV